MAGQDGPHRGALRPRLDARHRRPRGGRRAHPEISRQRVPGREQARRQWQSRHRHRRQGRAGRHNDRRQHRRPARHQHAAFFETALRSAHRHRADHATGDAAERARGQPGAEGQHGCRAGGPAQGQSRQIQFRLDRQRLGLPPHHRSYRDQDRRKAHASALPGFAASDHRGDPQRCATGLPAGDFGDAARGGRDGENSRGVDGEALAVPARCADAERVRHRRRSRRLERPDCAGRHTRGHHRADQQGCGRDHQATGGARQARDAIDGSRRQFAGRIPRADRRRDRALGAGDQGGEYQSELEPPERS